MLAKEFLEEDQIDTWVQFMLDDAVAKYKSKRCLPGEWKELLFDTLANSPMTKIETAKLIGISTSQLDNEVKLGRMPAPIKIQGICEKVWRTRVIIKYIHDYHADHPLFNIRK